MRPIYKLMYWLLALGLIAVISWGNYKIGQSQLKHYMRNYQIEVYNDTIWLYRGDKLVSKYITDYSKGLDSIIYQDNN